MAPAITWCSPEFTGYWLGLFTSIDQYSQPTFPPVYGSTQR
jgi:hypothetical protein